jgi:hypothetical protein
VTAVPVWRYLDQGGHPIGSSGSFDDDEAAEAWLGDRWMELRREGVAAVVLVDEESGKDLYRMSLSEQEDLLDD